MNDYLIVVTSPDTYEVIVTPDPNYNIDVTIDPPANIDVSLQQGPQGPAGVGVPSGGTTGQILAKLSNANYDTGWEDLEASNVIVLPSGGITSTNAQAALEELDAKKITKIDAIVAAIVFG